MSARPAASIPDAQEQQAHILRTDALVKTYGNFTALDRVSIHIRRGTIHGLLGENGAGKSTLVGLVSGLKTPTSGRILFDGEEVQGQDVKSMEARGLFLVTQEPMIVDPMTVAENLLLGCWPTRRGFVDWTRLRNQAAQMLEGTGLHPDQPAGSLGAVDKRKLNILRALFSGGRLIILDEPTTALTVDDRRHLFDFMRTLKAQGVTFIFISHYNEEILEICDAVTVLRDGRLAGETDEIASMSSDSLSELVLGRDLDLFQRRKRAGTGPDRHQFTQARARQVAVGHFSIAPGEIVGFAGLPGSGAKEFAQCLFGLNPARSGSMSVGGLSGPLPADPRAAFDHGIAYLSDDRRRDGLVSVLSIGENLTLSSLNRLQRRGLLQRDAERTLIDTYFRDMGVKAAGPDVVIDTLSGGNQQKVCLGRVIATDPRILILDEPTRGIDVGVKEDVHRIIDRLTASGLSVIIVTTDLDEMARLVDRVCIFADGDIVETLEGDAITTERLRDTAFNRHRAVHAGQE